MVAASTRKYDDKKNDSFILDVSEGPDKTVLRETKNFVKNKLELNESFSECFGLELYSVFITFRGYGNDNTSSMYYVSN